MITAIVLISADVDRIPEVGQAIAELDGVSEVYSVTGDVDLIAMVRVREHEELADVIADRLNKVAGVRPTKTHIAFRTYSRHDLEAAFSTRPRRGRLTTQRRARTGSRPPSDVDAAGCRGPASRRGLRPAPRHPGAHVRLERVRPRARRP